jgi:hypothetical protein
MRATHFWSGPWGPFRLALAGLVGLGPASLAWSADPRPGLDVPWVVTTGALPPLSSQSLPLDAAVDGFASRMTLELGFASREIPGPGTLFDSLTVSLLGPAPGQVATLFTADVTGLTVAPFTPGGLTLAPGALSFSSLAPLEPLLEGATVAYAYRAEVVLPAEVAAGGWTVQFDAFDNGNAVASRSSIQVRPIPEPGVVALLTVGLVAWGVARGIRKS